MTSPEGFIEAFIAERLSAGLTFQQAASALHHALVAFSKVRGLSEPSWPLSSMYPLLPLEQCAALMEGTRVSGEGASSGASLQPLPDGNHGENVLQGASL